MNTEEKRKCIKTWLEGASQSWIDIIYSMISNVREPSKK